MADQSVAIVFEAKARNLSYLLAETKISRSARDADGQFAAIIDPRFDSASLVCSSSVI